MVVHRYDWTLPDCNPVAVKRFKHVFTPGGTVPRAPLFFWLRLLFFSRDLPSCRLPLSVRETGPSAGYRQLLENKSNAMTIIII